jgi:hypothetical protein
MVILNRGLISIFCVHTNEKIIRLVSDQHIHKCMQKFRVIKFDKITTLVALCTLFL